MDHDKIEAVLKGLEIFDPDLSIAQANVTERASELIRDLRTECDNQATKIVDLEENAEAIPEMMAALETIAAIADDMSKTPITPAHEAARIARAVLQKVKKT